MSVAGRERMTLAHTNRRTPGFSQILRFAAAGCVAMAFTGCSADMRGADESFENGETSSLSSGGGITAAADSWIASDRPTENHGADTTLRVRNAAPTRRAIVQIDLSSVPACAKITSADLQLTIHDRGRTSRTYEVHQVTSAWNELGGVSWGQSARCA